MSRTRFRVLLRGWFLVALGPVLNGCGEDVASTPAAAGRVCVDPATGAAFVVETTIFPAVHPGTGKATLVPALYCSKCAAWHAAPPVEQLHRQRGVAHCPRTGTVLTADGPRPNAAAPNP
jgi:hypothetical protein